MVYSHKLVACIKVDGKVLREQGEIVSIPFGSEYSIYLKNLNSVRVQVKVSIDGTDATDGTWLVIQPNSSIELERSLKGGNMNRGNRFKFIERTGKIEKHRGIGGEDGLIRIEYQTEKVLPKPIHVPVIHYDYYARPYVWWPTYQPWGTTFIYGGAQYVCNSNLSNNLNDCDNVTFTTTTGAALNSQPFIGSMMSFNASSVAPSKGLRSTLTKSAGPLRSRSIQAQSLKMEEAEVNDAGITVAGSESDQQFHWASAFPVHETSDVLVLKLRGAVGGQRVVKAVTVKTKPTCTTCGKKNRPTVKFCAECGTALSII
jgi:hypothetical protein